MRTIRKTNSNFSKSLVIIGIVIVILALGVGAYWLYTTHRDSSQTTATPSSKNEIDYREATDDQKSAGSAIKDQVVTSQQQETAPSATTGITITSTDKSDGTLHIRTLIDKVTNSGSCTLTMSGPSSKSFTASAKVQPMASSSTCAGFDIPLDTLVAGTWKITVSFTDGSSSGSASSEVSI